MDGPADIIADTLRSCNNIRKIGLNESDLTDEQLLQIVEAVRGHRELEELSLHINRIGNDGCDAICTLLEDPNCTLQTILLGSNRITNEGAFAIVNFLNWRTNSGSKVN